MPHFLPSNKTLIYKPCDSRHRLQLQNSDNRCRLQFQNSNDRCHLLRPLLQLDTSHPRKAIVKCLKNIPISCLSHPYIKNNSILKSMKSAIIIAIIVIIMKALLNSKMICMDQSKYPLVTNASPCLCDFYGISFTAWLGEFMHFMSVSNNFKNFCDFYRINFTLINSFNELLSLWIIIAIIVIIMKWISIHFLKVKSLSTNDRI